MPPIHQKHFFITAPAPGGDFPPIGKEMEERYRMTHYLRYCCAMFFALFSFLLATPLSAQAQTREAYVAQSADKTTLTFYYDALRATRTGTTWGIGETVTTKNDSYPAWAGNDEANNNTATQVVFDVSFREFRPTTTAKWFYGCSKLEQIKNLENINAQNVTDMSLMFGACYRLTALDLSHLNTQNVTNMSRMFVACNHLTALDLSHLNTQNVTNMSGMFGNCIRLTTLDLSHLNTQNVTDMSLMFGHCLSLTALDLSHLNTQNVTNMSGMFFECNSLTTLDVSHFNTQNVTDMSQMFDACYRLTTLDLSNFNTQNVEYMSQMFRDCKRLTALDLSNFNTQNVKTMQEMFRDCKRLTALDLSNFNTQNVKNMQEMFSGCAALTTINSNTTWQCPQSADMFVGCTQLKGAVAYDEIDTDATMANPETGYFTAKSTKVESVRFGAEGAQHIYTLQGKRMRGEWKHLPAGVYIVNGKKWIKP